MNKLRLIPEQIKYIENRLKKSENNYMMSKANIRNNDKRAASCGAQGFDYIPDFVSLEELGHIKTEIAELKHLINNSEIVSEYDDQKINIGTRFSATLEFGKGDVDTMEYILVEGPIIKDNEEVTYISINSPLGQAVYCKKIGEVICYYGPNQTLVGGIIDTIAPSRVPDDAIIGDNGHCIRLNK